MNSSPAASSSTSGQSISSREDEKSNSAYQAASDPVRQGASAAPLTANVPFMYNNNPVTSGPAIGSDVTAPARTGQIEYGRAGTGQPLSAQTGSAVTAPAGAGQIVYGGGDTAQPFSGAGQIAYGGANANQSLSSTSDVSPSPIQYGPSRADVRALAEGGGGAGFSHRQLPPEAARVDLSRPFYDGNVSISHTSGFPAEPGRRHETLSINTGNGSDSVHIDRGRDGGLLAQVNGQSYDIPFRVNARNQQSISINTGGGNDGISVGAGEDRNVTIRAGAGNDIVYAGPGRTSVYGGTGDDIINLGSGEGYAEGNDGNDVITGGTGNSVIYGGNGSDELRAGGGANTKVNYVDGGDGNDYIVGGRGYNILHGGKGDDVIFGGDKNAIYTGEGRDSVQTYSEGSRVFGQHTDDLSQLHPSTLSYNVTPSNGGHNGIKIQGSADFTQRVEDDLNFYRGSPTGQKSLEIIDSLEAPVSVREGLYGNYYHYSDPGLGIRNNEENRRRGLEDGYIRDGMAGAPAQTPVVTYNRSFITPGHQRPPVVVLHHELAHAINGGTGTFLPGDTILGPGRNGPVTESNVERQAVGLPTSSDPFDFDNNPLTPPTTANPWPYTENSLLYELGLPPRRKYSD